MRNSGLLALAVLAGCMPAGAVESAPALGEDTPVRGGSGHDMRVEADISARKVGNAGGGVAYNPGTRAKKRWKRTRRQQS